MSAAHSVRSISIGAESDSVISVAEDALSEQQGKYFLYIEEMPGITAKFLSHPAPPTDIVARYHLRLFLPVRKS